MSKLNWNRLIFFVLGGLTFGWVLSAVGRLFRKV